VTSKPIKAALSTSTVGDGWSLIMLNDRENILNALREKPLKVYEIVKRANVVNEEACQVLLLKMREEGLVKFDIHKGRWLIG
jgi:DNA-binding IclR family transcriptional regulator